MSDKRSYYQEYYQKNRDKIKQRSKLHHAQYRDEDNRKAIQRYEDDKEGYYKRARRWISENPDKKKLYQARYRETHRLEINQRANERRRGIDRSKEKMARRSLEFGQPCTFGEFDWQSVLMAFDGKCAYCRQTGKMTRDHFLPLAYPGGGTIPGNIVPACRSCNSGKQNKLPHVWAVERFGLERYLEISEVVNSILWNQ